MPLNGSNPYESIGDLQDVEVRRQALPDGTPIIGEIIGPKFDKTAGEARSSS